MSDPADWRNSTTEVDTPENEAVATAPLQLVTIVGPDVRTRPLRRGAFVVGRGEDADVQLDATQVSRRHVRLIVDGGILLEDCGSANGTVIRGRRLQEGEAVPLQVGEPVVLGRRATLVVLAGASPAALDTHAASGELDRLLQLADQVADSELKILITGETGVGKDVLARRIHEHSSRRGGPFVVVDTAAIAGSVLESELFGYEKGAFTGAAQSKRGLLEAAAGGTLFLDELGELPLALQPKLLRALEA
jgi:pSer/pThr/pTyr-binding forkhead associated (FHA) protein